MDPATLALLAQTGASIFGGAQASGANSANAHIALLNYYAQERARQQAADEARRQQTETKLGTTDAAGNRTYFVPGRGWVTELTEDQRALQEGTEQEQLRQLTSGAERAETVARRAAGQRSDEDVMASAAMDELRRARPADEDALRQLFLARGADVRNDAADRTGELISRQAIRAGGGGNAAELMQRGRGIADQEGARSAGVEATLQARETGERDFDRSRDKATQLYDYFSRKATSGTTPPQGFTPTAPPQGSSGVANQGLINALARPSQQEYQSPNLAWPDTVSDVGSAVQGYESSRRDQEMMDMLRAKWGTPQPEQRTGGNTGMFSRFFRRD